MENVKAKRCQTPLCGTIIDGKYRAKGYCLRCCIHMFPDEPHTRNYKTKEATVSAFIDTTFPDVSWISDRRVFDGCSLRRPDKLVDLGDQVIVVEVDENQHQDYDCSCENKRLMEISRDLGHRPLVFIRFNPDDYVGADGVSHTSCWGVNAAGISGIKKSKVGEWAGRLEALKTQIQYWMENRTEKTVEIVQLYYDGF
jgi:hypothetical protein